MISQIKINGRAIGRAYPPYIVAEMSGNHKGDFGRALAIIDAAAEAGADAVKLQTYTADTITLDCEGVGFNIEGGLWDKRRLYELYEEAHTPWSWHQKLFEKGTELGISVFSSPFDFSAVELLEKLEAPAYKIASFELVDHPLIERCAATGKPLVISTGMANKAEIAEALQAAKRGGCTEIILLHCVSSYPTLPKDANLLTMADLANSFDVIPGFSDHTQGNTVSMTAIALGACFIEKHFTLCREDGGPDAVFSLEPPELRKLVEGCRTTWEALGEVNYERKGSEVGNELLRRSLYVVADVPAGGYLTLENIRSIRPGFGMAPKFLPEVIGSRARRALKRGEPLAMDMVDPEE